MEIPNAQQTKDLLAQAKTVYVIVGTQPDSDVMAAAGALCASLQVADKDVRFFSPRKPDQTHGVAWAENIKSEIGHQNLTISFDYSEDSVDKVSYHIGEETNKFYLTIKPKKGKDPLNSDSVEFSYTGAEADLVILVGVSNLEDLEQLYFGYEKLYKDTGIISINTYPTSFGTIKFDTTKVTGYAELVAQMIDTFGWSLNADVATSLLRVLEQTSNNFSSHKATADTFEVAAQLLRNGARRTQPEYRSPSVAVPADNTSVSQQPKQQEISVAREDSKQSGQKNQQKQHKKQDKQQKKKAGGLAYQPSNTVARN